MTVNTAHLQTPQAFARWLLRQPPDWRDKFLAGFVEASDATQDVVVQMIDIEESDTATDAEKFQANRTICDALCLRPHAGRYGMDLQKSETEASAKFPRLRKTVERMDEEETGFSDTLRQLMELKCVTQSQLAERIGVNQPAISLMLKRRCRPQRTTILRLAEALGVDPTVLWPDLEVSELLDSRAEANADRPMTPEEAEALKMAKQRSPSSVPASALPRRRR